MKKTLLAFGLCSFSLLLGACGGSDGADGKAGADGADGADGSEGSQGPAGAQGSDGDKGADGETGADGAKGADGSKGSDGAAGVASLIEQTTLAAGDEHCFLGGVQVDSGPDTDGSGTLEAGEVSETTYLCQPEKFGTHGQRLPFSVLRNDLENSAFPGSTFEIRSGGFGSDAARHPTNPMQFYALTDRGPNADYTGVNGAGKIFAVEDYTPRIGLFEVQPDGSIERVKTILLRDPSGTVVTGLPNPVYGATNEIPYDAKGEPIVVDPNQPYDAVNNPYRLDAFGIDSEGLVAVSDGTFWVSDEYGPHIVHFDADGKELGRINAFAADTRNGEGVTLPAEFQKRRANRGMEGLTITPDEKMLVGIMQSTISNPTGAVNSNTLTRIVTIDLETKAVGQYLYKQELKANSNSGIVALSDESFLVIERDGSFLADSASAMKDVYKISLQGATNLETVVPSGDVAQDDALGLTIGGKTLEQVGFEADGWEQLAAKNIVPVTKTLVVNMATEVGYPHDKMEGLWLIDEHRLGVLNDDDFALWSDNNTMSQKYLDAAKSQIDGNTLYIVDGLDLTP